jgi:hypothetical protein
MPGIYSREVLKMLIVTEVPNPPIPFCGPFIYWNDYSLLLLKSKSQE